MPQDGSGDKDTQAENGLRGRPGAAELQLVQGGSSPGRAGAPSHSPQAPGPSSPALSPSFLPPGDADPGPQVGSVHSSLQSLCSALSFPGGDFLNVCVCLHSEWCVFVWG